MKTPEFKHYFCQSCADKRKPTLIDNPMMGYTMRWEPISDSDLQCGTWSDQGVRKQGQGCGKSATVALIGLNGNPITYMAVNASPILEGLPPIVSDV